MYEIQNLASHWKESELWHNIRLQKRTIELGGPSKLLHTCFKLVHEEWQLGDHSTQPTMPYRTRRLSRGIIRIQSYLQQLYNSFNFFNDSSFTHRLSYNASRGTVSFPSFCFPSLSFHHSASQRSRLVYWFWQVPMPAQSHT